MTRLPSARLFLCLAGAGLMAGCGSTGRDTVASDATGNASSSPGAVATIELTEAEQDGTISLSVSFMLEEVEGEVLMSLFSDEEGWDANVPLRGMTRSVDAARIEIAVEDLPPGTYAIKAFQDVNGNGVLDTNFVGIPTEPYGFSNGQAGRFGPPSFEAASFAVDGAGHQEIGLN